MRKLNVIRYSFMVNKMQVSGKLSSKFEIKIRVNLLSECSKIHISYHMNSQALKI